MSKIYKTTDKIPVKIGDITITISPLGHLQKAEVQELLFNGKIVDATKAAALALKYSLKEIDGVYDASGEPYELQFDSNNMLTDECIDDLFNLSENGKLATVCLNLMNGVPGKFMDLQTGDALEGVSFVEDKKPRKKQKAQ